MTRPLNLESVQNFSTFQVKYAFISLHKEKAKNVSNMPDEVAIDEDAYIYNAMVTLYKDETEEGKEIALMFHLNMSSLVAEELISRAVEMLSELCGFHTIRDLVMVFDGSGVRIKEQYSIIEVLSNFDEIDEIMSDEDFMKTRVLH